MTAVKYEMHMIQKITVFSSVLCELALCVMLLAIWGFKCHSSTAAA